MHFLSETPVYDCVALESHASDKQLNLIIFDLEVSVFYNFYKKMDLFVKIVGLCRPTYVFFITFVNLIIVAVISEVSTIGIIGNSNNIIAE